MSWIELDLVGFLLWTHTGFVTSGSNLMNLTVFIATASEPTMNLSQITERKKPQVTLLFTLLSILWLLGQVYCHLNQCNLWFLWTLTGWAAVFQPHRFPVWLEYHTAWFHGPRFTQFASIWGTAPSLFLLNTAPVSLSAFCQGQESRPWFFAMPYTVKNDREMYIKSL